MRSVLLRRKQGNARSPMSAEGGYSNAAQSVSASSAPPAAAHSASAICFLISVITFSLKESIDNYIIIYQSAAQCKREKEKSGCFRLPAPHWG